MRGFDGTRFYRHRRCEHRPGGVGGQNASWFTCSEHLPRSSFRPVSNQLLSRRPPDGGGGRPRARAPDEISTGNRWRRSAGRRVIIYIIILYCCARIKRVYRPRGNIIRAHIMHLCTRRLQHYLYRRLFTVQYYNFGYFKYPYFEEWREVFEDKELRICRSKTDEWSVAMNWTRFKYY